MKVIQRPFVKIKRLSGRRKTILLRREIETHLRRKWERDKMHAILESVATINFKTLRITADPTIDVDYVKGMSAVSIYGHNYRRPMRENISEDSVHIRPDVTRKLGDLTIGDENGGDCKCDVSASQRHVEIDILQKTSSLRVSDRSEPSINDRVRNIVLSENVKEERRSWKFGEQSNRLPAYSLIQTVRFSQRIHMYKHIAFMHFIIFYIIQRRII